MESKTKEYQVTRRENDILYVLWSAGRPLMASEIANDELMLTTVHTTLKRMLKKNLVEVVDFVKSGNVYGRCYQPTVSLSEYEMSKMSNDFKKIKSTEVTVTDLVAELLKNEDKETVKKELDELEQVIKDIRNEIKEKQKNT